MSQQADAPPLEPLNPTALAQQPARARATLIERSRAAGLRGLGGGGFPLASKLNQIAPNKPLLINAMESEPENFSDSFLVREQPAALALGSALLALASDASELIVALPASTTPVPGRWFGASPPSGPELSTAAVSAFAAALGAAFTTLKLGLTARCVRLPVDHASGAEWRLAERLELVPEVSAGRAPLSDRGVLCQNAGTAVALHDAVVLGEPLRRRVVTVAGQPAWYRLGTPVTALLDAEAYWRNGRDGGERVTRAAAGSVSADLFCLSAALPAAEQPCINCGACAPLCPEGLAPAALHEALRRQDDAAAVRLDLDACIECGACNSVCPADLPLAQQFRAARRRLRQQRDAAAAAATARARSAARDQRLQQAAARQAARRAARERGGPPQW